MLEVRNLTKCYNNIPVVERVSFVIRPGEILGYLGPNGAGNARWPHRTHVEANFSSGTDGVEKFVVWRPAKSLGRRGLDLDRG